MIAQTCELESIPEEQADGTISKPGGLKSNEPTTPVSKPKLNMISDLLEDSKDKLSVNPMYNFDKSMSVASIQDQKVKFDEIREEIMNIRSSSSKNTISSQSSTQSNFFANVEKIVLLNKSLL